MILFINYNALQITSVLISGHSQQCAFIYEAFNTSELTGFDVH